MTKAVVVYRYGVYDSHRDDYVVSTRMATPEKIERVRGEPIPGSFGTTNRLIRCKMDRSGKVIRFQ